MSANLYELLSKPFQEFSDSVAIECHERGIWTYGELEEQTARSVSYTHLRAHETTEHMVCRKNR